MSWALILLGLMLIIISLGLALCSSKKAEVIAFVICGIFGFGVFITGCYQVVTPDPAPIVETDYNYCPYCGEEIK